MRSVLAILAKLMLAVAVVGLVGALVVFPLFAARLGELGWLPEGWPSWLPWITGVQTVTMQLLVLAWVFFFGACLASFLNVVAWRLPRGRGINGSSHCPHCNVRLKMSDNIPVYGWLKNHGRCRSCQTPITSRYLLVEIALGLITLMIVSLEVFWGGINLPSYPPGNFEILRNAVLTPQTILFWHAGLHLILIYSLFTFTVIRSERLPIPASIALVSGLVGIAMLVAIPELTLMPWSGITVASSQSARNWFQGQPMTLLCGGLVGVGIGWLVNRIPWVASAPTVKTLQVNPGRPVISLDDASASLGLVGLFLGWQAAVVIVIFQLTFVAIIRRVIERLHGRGHWIVPVAGQILVATLVFIVGCRWILSWG